MKKNAHFHFFFFTTLALFLASCAPKSILPVVQTPIETELQRPKNIVLLIGDGMGISQISTAFFYQQDHLSNFPRFKHIGLINTSSATHKITDSAAGATAFSCGVKTYNNAISMGVDSMPIPTIVEIIGQTEKLRSGLVSTSSITHATPATFYAHAKHRKQEYEIAGFLPGSKVDFFAGGGIKFFRANWDRFAEQNIQVDSTILPNGPVNWDYNKRYGYLLAENGMPSMIDGRGDFLEQASKRAIEYLSGSGNPFFLMIEGSQIDWGGHNNDYDYVATELLDFDRTIGHVLDFAEKEGNTLVIVLADHETGGLTLAGAPVEGDKMGGDYNTIEGLFSTGGHSAALIPVFAFGPGAEQFIGIYQNHEVFHKMLDLLGFGSKR